MNNLKSCPLVMLLLKCKDCARLDKTMLCVSLNIYRLGQHVYDAAQDVLSLNRLIDRYSWPVANGTLKYIACKRTLDTLH